MSYLTYTEYTELGFAEIDQTEFDKLLKRASDVLDAITRDFYQFNDLETDIPFRKDKFKKAVACQIEYFHEAGSTTSYGISEPVSVQIGRTSMTSGGSNAKNEPQNSIVSQDVYMYLDCTGLLYRGVRVV